MASILIVYGSTTGNTAFVADTAAKAMEKAGHQVTKKDVTDASAPGLCDGYDLIMFGCSTWGDDSIELQDNFISLFEEFDQINAAGKNTAVFGCGLSDYTYFCGAVDAIEEKLNQLGANVLDTLKIDGDPQSERSEIESWLQKIASKLS